MGAHDFKYNKGPLFGRKNREYQYFDVCCPETSSCASKPLLLRYKLVKPQCMCQVSLGLKEVQIGAHDFKYNKVPLFAKKSGNMNTSMSAALIRNSYKIAYSCYKLSNIYFKSLIYISLYINILIR